MKSLLPALFALALFFTACTPNNVTVDNSLGSYFDSAGVKGCFGFFDNNEGHFTIYNLSRYRDSLYQPGATFDILLSLIGIQTGIVKDSSARVGDSTSLEQAFQQDQFTKSAADPRPQYRFFQNLSRQLGRDTIRKWVDSLRYGNQQVGADTEAYWMNNGLKIVPDEELGLLKKLYFNQLPFFGRTQRVVCGMMRSEKNSSYQLSYKTAQGIKEDGHAIGWVMGWIEENKHPYFFVVNLESADPNKDLAVTGLKIARDILRKRGFFQGKM